MCLWKQRGRSRNKMRNKTTAGGGPGAPPISWLMDPTTAVQGRILLLTICAAGIGGTFQFGYNLSIINAPTLHIQEFTNETWQMRTGRPLPDHLVLLVWSLIISLYPLGGLLGALLAGPLAIKLGRKKSLLVNNIFVVAAATLFGFSRRAGSFEMIMLGRLLVGVSAGMRRGVMGAGGSSCRSVPFFPCILPCIPFVPFIHLLLFFLGPTHGLWKLLGQGSNPCHSSDNAESLTY
uniref:Major facilitator superfamily (MFS) profile domain-containing protein n=1 Tax=Sus scrofa TaxID=9823 RepID=A0A8D1FDM2_PIG